MTADEIRSLEAGPAADLAFAEAVGLKVYAVSYWDTPKPLIARGEDGTLFLHDGIDRPELCGNCPVWHPSTDTGQALGWAAKWLEGKGVGFGLVKYEHASDYWLWDFSCGRVSSYGKTAALAVVRGILLVALAVKK